MVGHAGAVLLHRVADRIGLVGGLRGALAARAWRLDRANVLVSLVVGIALGARNLRQAELLARHRVGLLGVGVGLDVVADARGDRRSCPASDCQGQGRGAGARVGFAG